MGLFVKKLSAEEEEKQIINNNNVFEGINCEVEFPNKQLKIGTRDGLTRGAATLAFGLVGLAATSSIKHKEETRKISTTFQIVEKGVVFKKATMNGEDLRISYENIVSSGPLNKGDQCYIKLLKNQDIIIKKFWLKNLPTNNLILAKSYLVNHIAKILNERACGAQYEEAGWGLEHATEQSLEPETSKDSSLMDELERLGNMYEKGLLTDEEFVLMKQKLIAGNNEDTIMQPENTVKSSVNSCENCGAKISSEDAFCSECGNKIQ